MSELNIFEIASREKYRFETSIGNLTVENLWDIPLSSPGNKATLNSIAIDLYNKTKDDEVSFVSAKRKNVHLLNKLEVVKHIISVRLEEAEKKKTAEEAREKKRKIDDIIAKKQDTSLENMSLEELMKLRETL